MCRVKADAAQGVFYMFLRRFRRRVLGPRQVTCTGGLIYGVRSGQTLFRISRIFGVSVSDIQAANPGIDPNNLQIGQLLCIPGVAEQICPRGDLRTIRQGDTLSTIAQEAGLVLSDLIAANTFIPNPDEIFAGEQICVPRIIRFPCCFVLEPEPATIELGIRGVLMIEQLNETSRLTFAAVNLPAPSRFGNFDSYLGQLVFREIDFSARLARTDIPGQPVVWTGATAINVPPGAANFAFVVPANTPTGQQGAPILRGRVIDCR